MSVDSACDAILALFKDGKLPDTLTIAREHDLTPVTADACRRIAEDRFWANDKDIPQPTKRTSRPNGFRIANHRSVYIPRTKEQR